MKKFLAVFLGSSTGAKAAEWNAMEPEARKAREQAGMQGWTDWMSNNAASLADPGAPLGKAKHVDESGVSDLSNMMSAYTVVHAESHEAAAKLFENHPHFSIFPGDSVEIMECMPIPQM